MFKPETSITGFGDKVIVLTDNDVGYAFGTYTGNTTSDGGRPASDSGEPRTATECSESYEIRTIDALTGDTVDTSFYHKEDIFQTSKENLERVREMVR